MGLTQSELNYLTAALEDPDFPDLIGLVMREMFVLEMKKNSPVRKGKKHA